MWFWQNFDLATDLIIIIITGGRSSNGKDFNTIIDILFVDIAAEERRADTKLYYDPLYRDEMCYIHTQER